MTPQLHRDPASPTVWPDDLSTVVTIHTPLAVFDVRQWRPRSGRAVGGKRVMEYQKLSTNSSDVNEQAIREEIEYYEHQAALARETPGHKSWAVRTSYLDFAARRRMLLAALQDGRPEAWREYRG